MKVLELQLSVVSCLLLVATDYGQQTIDSTTELFFEEGLIIGATVKGVSADDEGRHFAFAVVDGHNQLRRAGRRFDIDLLISDAALIEKTFRHPTVGAPSGRVHLNL